MTFDEWFRTYLAFTVIDTTIGRRMYIREVMEEAYNAAQPQWQPIETAPLREEILLKFPMGYVYNGSSLSGHRWYPKYEVVEDQPTHWMPIPKLPEEN